MVTDDNRETNLVAMVAVKANSEKLPYDVVRILHVEKALNTNNRVPKNDIST
jgi:hypothetical protein